MQTLHPTRRPRTVALVQAASLIAVAFFLGACDRHSAEETPESYGHGSSRNRNYHSHQLDSRTDSRHFSDTVGTEVESKSETKEKAEASPAASPGGHFF